MVFREHYFITHPGSLRIDGGDGEYPSKNDGSCLCVMDAGYIDHCNAGEGFFDCRDCWNKQYQPN